MPTAVAADFDKTLRYEELDKSGRVVEKVEGVKAYTKGDPAKDEKLKWFVNSRTTRTTVMVGNQFVDESGRVWVVKEWSPSPNGGTAIALCVKKP